MTEWLSDDEIFDRDPRGKDGYETDRLWATIYRLQDERDELRRLAAGDCDAGGDYHVTGLGRFMANDCPVCGTRELK